MPFSELPKLKEIYIIQSKVEASKTKDASVESNVHGPLLLQEQRGETDKSNQDGTTVVEMHSI